MKFNFANIKKVIIKNKFLVLSVLIIILYVTYFNPFREGLGMLESSSSSIGEYDYLAPIPSENTWSEDTTNSYVAKYNSVIKDSSGNSGQLTPENAKFLYNFALEEEAQYYIKNGKFPINSHVTNYLIQNPDLFSNQKMPNGEPLNSTNVSKLLPNRYLYAFVIAPKEDNLTPQPLSFQIFMGTAKPPAASSSYKNMLGMGNSSSTSSSLSDSNYQELVSLCKNVVNK
jgi:hypothetical protein